MGSYDYGKADVCRWIRDNFTISATILDMGACDGKWRYLLPEYKNMDAVEAYRPFYRKLGEKRIYRNLWHADARTFEYQHYDLIIFGDIVEHMSPEDAKKMLDYAKPRCWDMIIAVPYLYPQDAGNGNKYDIHVQDDLTAELFEERYPGYSVLCAPTNDYRYYHK